MFINITVNYQLASDIEITDKQIFTSGGKT